LKLSRSSAATWRLKIYGNPQDFPDYYARLRALSDGCQTIQFCGTFPNAEIAHVLAEIDALVVPSLWYENTPLVVYSALAAQCPVIASDLPGLSEVVRHGWNGLTFPAGDVASLHCRLARLVGETDLLVHLTANCKKPKSTTTYVDELLLLYSQRSTRKDRPTTPPFERQYIEPLEGAEYGVTLLAGPRSTLVRRPE